MTTIVLAVRFLLEIVTVLGIISGVFINRSIQSKIVSFFLSIAIVLLWARYGAPKSPNVLSGVNKFVLEIFVYGVGSIAFYKLFGDSIGTIYLSVVVVDLFFMYVLGLQGN